MDLSQLADLRIALRLAGIEPRKGLGQHFLIDRTALEQIVAAADLQPKDTVLEIGPGLGVMTNLLTASCRRVVAVETDKILAELLEKDAAANLEVRSEDIIDFDLSLLGQPYKVVANLPYYLTSKIFRLLLESSTPPQLMSLLVQKEVAERVVALPGRLSILALSVQYYAEAEVIGVVERHKFWPPPQVDSAILKITLRPSPAFPADKVKLFRLIKAGFGEKRKQLKNSLAGGLNASVDICIDMLKQTNLQPTARAQELSLQQWEKLYRVAEKRGLLA
jgi:16S rRNA (adenine1518-N6/adenine1519-N6)-dimethyltransferase